MNTVCNAFLFSERSVVSGRSANPRSGQPTNDTTNIVYINILQKIVQFQWPKQVVGRMDETTISLFEYFESYWRNPLLGSSSLWFLIPGFATCQKGMIIQTKITFWLYHILLSLYMYNPKKQSVWYDILAQYESHNWDILFCFWVWVIYMHNGIDK